MSRLPSNATRLLSGCALALLAAPAAAQDLQDRGGAPPPASSFPAAASAAGAEQVQFSANALEYDTDADIVTATGDVRMAREGQRLRGDTVTWNRKTGRVLATGNIAVTNAQGDVAYGDSIELGDTLKTASSPICWWCSKKAGGWPPTRANGAMTAR